MLDVANKFFWEAIKINNNEIGSYYELSAIASTQKDCQKLLRAINCINNISLSPRDRLFLDFASANCLHKLKNYKEASKSLISANTLKLVIHPSNAHYILEKIKAVAMQKQMKLNKPETKEFSSLGCRDLAQHF